MHVTRTRPQPPAMKRFERPPPSARRPMFWPWALLVLLILITGATAGAMVGFRLYGSVEQLVKDNKGKIVDKPIRVANGRPVVSEPYRVEGIPIPKVESPEKHQEKTTSNPTVIVEYTRSFTRCPGRNMIEQDICANNRLVEIDQRAAEHLREDYSDPRYQEYLRLRQKWCEPQPSRRNRTECLLDIGEELLQKL